MSPPTLARIGRDPTPAERGLGFALENMAILEAMAENLFLEANGFDVAAAEQWQALGDDLREVWRERALELQRAHVATAPDPSTPDDPDPGASFPVVASELAA